MSDCGSLFWEVIVSDRGSRKKWTCTSLDIIIWAFEIAKQYFEILEIQPLLSKKLKTGVQYVNLCHHQKQQWYALTAYLFQIHNFCQFFFSLSPSFMRKTAKSIVWTITHRNHVEVSDVWCENLKVMFNLRYIIIFFSNEMND